MRYLLACLSALFVVVTVGAQAAPSVQTVSVQRFRDVRILKPDAAPSSTVVYVSDRAGWAPADDAVVEALREGGSIVLAVDLSAYAAALDAWTGACLYVVGEITDLAQTAQRMLDVQTYLPPIVVGRGEGATFAYAALADAPANTLGGAVAVGFANRLSLRLPFCPGATTTKAPDGAAWRYAFDKAMPEPATLLAAADVVDALTREAAAQPSIDVQEIDETDSPRQAADAVAKLAEAIEPFGDLPAVDIPSTTPPRAVAVFVSGDGGWRDLDKTMGEWLATQGVHVVGIDALHYFWSRRTPQDLADDVARLVGDVDTAGTLPVLLLGYSFGADTLPFAYPALPAELRDRTRLLALLGPGRSTSFQVTISGWLGVGNDGYDVPAAIAKLPRDRVLCICGKDDEDASCGDPAMAGVPVVALDGGHHFDGDYEGLARRILTAAGLR